MVQGLRGQSSNHQVEPTFRRQVLQAYRRRYADCGPTFASEKLAAEGLVVTARTWRR